MARAFGKAVIIGLGGTGQLVLVRIKKMFQDHCGGKLPPCVKLLAFDTDSERKVVKDAQGKVVTFGDQEFLHMTVSNVGQAAVSAHVKPWWIPHDALKHTSVLAGTGGVREVGRLSVFVNIDKITARLKGAFEEISQYDIKAQMESQDVKLLDLTPQVFVVGSFAGGTGSGSFVDFSILSRLLGGQDMFYSAHFVLPSIYNYRARTANENAYAALLELEHLNKSDRKPYQVQYSGQYDFTLLQRPYHIVNLIDSQCRNGRRIQEPRELAQFVGEGIFNSVGAIGQQARAVVDNIMTMINSSSPADWKGRHAWYSTFGVSSIVYPGAEIHERYSIGFAIKLVEQALEAMKAPPKLPLEQISAKVIRPFIVEKGLVVKNRQLLEKLYPAQDLPEYALDKSINLRDPDYRQECKSDLDRWRTDTSRRIESRIKSTAKQPKVEIWQAISQLLSQLKKGEASGKYPRGSHRAAVSLLRGHLENSRVMLTKAQSQLSDKASRLAEQTNRLFEAFPSSSKILKFGVTTQQNAFANFAESVQKGVHCQCHVKRIDAAIALCSAWFDQMEKLGDIVSKDKDKCQSAQTKLKNTLLPELYSRRNSLSGEQLRAQQSLFEIYIGDVDDEGHDTTYVREAFKEPSVPEAFRDFRILNNITDWSQLGDRTADQLAELFLSFARDMMRRGTDVSVLDVLRNLEQRREGTIARLMSQAVENSTLMLPLNETDLSGRDQDIAEFRVIGGEDQEALESVLGALVPTDVRIPNLWASTGERYRITICRYFAAIPLHVIDGMADIRAAYFKRLRPPAHTDINFEFDIPDAMPETERDRRALSLLCLAMLTVNEKTQEKRFGLEQEALIVREEPYEGPKCYYLDPLVLGGHVVDRDESKLPRDIPSGKFYDLYNGLSRDTELQEMLRKTLLALDEKEGFYQALLKDAKSKHDKYKGILREAQEGNIDPPFNRMETGFLYRREVIFYAHFQRDKPSIKDMLR